MLRPTLPAAAVLLGLAPGAATAPATAQLLVQQRIVVRMQRGVAPVAPTIWAEKKGPKCIPLDRLAGALVIQPDAVDLVQEGGARVRARLDDDCPSLNFYSGFYVKPTKDGKVCAGRDAIRSRTGRICEITSFRKLVAKR